MSSSGTGCAKLNALQLVQLSVTGRIGSTALMGVSVSPTKAMIEMERKLQATHEPVVVDSAAKARTLLNRWDDRA